MVPTPWTPQATRPERAVETVVLEEHDELQALDQHHVLVQTNVRTDGQPRDIHLRACRPGLHLQHVAREGLQLDQHPNRAASYREDQTPWC